MREMYETTQDEDLKAELKPLILNAASSVPDAKLSAGMKRFLANLKKEK
jgi:ABC-type transport system involved in cytochrome c biogenesis ATPase subunit